LGGSSASAEHQPRPRQPRAPRITVPGEVLAPYEVDYYSFGSDSEDYDSFDEPLTPRDGTPGRSLGSGKIRLKLSKKKDKGPKPPRGPRPPGVMGTNGKLISLPDSFVLFESSDPQSVVGAAIFI
jgi:hypothetical protein